MRIYAWVNASQVDWQIYIYIYAYICAIIFVYIKLVDVILLRNFASGIYIYIYVCVCSFIRSALILIYCIFLQTFLWCNTQLLFIQWGPWRLKSPALRLCVRQLIRANNKENIKSPYIYINIRFCHKEPIKQKALPCHAVIMFLAFTAILRSGNMICRRPYLIPITWKKLSFVLLVFKMELRYNWEL